MKKNIFTALLIMLALTAQTAAGKGKTVVWEHPATESNHLLLIGAN